MTNLRKHSSLSFTCSSFRKVSTLALFAALTLLTPSLTQAQTYQVLHTFTGGQDGKSPESGLIMDRAGNFYGTTDLGANQSCLGGCGTVFRISPRGILTTIYSFHGQDGDYPLANVTIASDGTLYGTTEFGGAFGAGNIYRLQPPARATANAAGTWSETVLYTFGPINNGLGVEPWYGPLIFDGAGNIYGTASAGGTGPCATGGCGTVFQLSPSNGDWRYSVLYRFTCEADSAVPFSGVILDAAGRLYGTTHGDSRCNDGTLFQLIPHGSTWSNNTLHTFLGRGDGDVPLGGLIMDAAGNIYGATTDGGAGGGGVIYELSPTGDGWTFTTLHSLTGSPGGGEESALTMDAAGNLYGTAGYDGAFHWGSIFKLTRNNGSWSYTDLYDFTGGADGAVPNGKIALDSSGNLYGTASYAGQNNNGVAWELTP